MNNVHDMGGDEYVFLFSYLFSFSKNIFNLFLRLMVGVGCYFLNLFLFFSLRQSFVILSSARGAAISCLIGATPLLFPSSDIYKMKPFFWDNSSFLQT